MLDQLIRTSGRLLKRTLPNYRAINRILLNITFKRNHGRWPLPIYHPDAEFEDFLVDRIIADEWSSLDRACSDKVDTKHIVRHLEPLLLTPETVDILRYSDLRSWHDLKDKLEPYFGKPLIAKPTHNSGGITFLLRGPDDDSIRRLYDAGAHDYFYEQRDTIYYGLPRRIIVEQDLSVAGVAPNDFKFFCSNGEVFLCQIDEGRFGDHRRVILQADTFEAIDLTYTYERLEHIPSKPDRYDDMLAICRHLSRGYAFVRIDLYAVGDQIYFGEFAFNPGGGGERFSREGFSRELFQRIRATGNRPALPAQQNHQEIRDKIAKEASERLRATLSAEMNQFNT